MDAITVTGLNLYPIKSAAGIAVRSARLDARGIAGDRRWMVVDEHRSFLTQRAHPRLALVSVAVDDRALTVSAPGMPALIVSIRPKTPGTVRVQVWDDACEAVRAGEDARAWFSAFLGFACELVYMSDDTVRAVAPRAGAPWAQVSFADAYPFLLLSEASLEDLNTRLLDPVPMNRFRPNLVVGGCAAYAEDGWKRIRVGAVVFHVVKPCSRCSITTVDQSTAVRGKEPLATLASFRRVGHEVLFGQNLVHEAPGELRVGDPVTVLE